MQKTKSKKKKSRKSKKMTSSRSLCLKSVIEWAFLGNKNYLSALAKAKDGFHVVEKVNKIVFDLHSHSKFSDGFLSPSKLVERAHRNGVNVLALTDHDTMHGIPEALEAAHHFGVKIIPGVEISAMFYPCGDGTEELVHILAYYGSCGPTKWEEVDAFLDQIRVGRFVRAKEMVSKLGNLKMPLQMERITRIAGDGVAPGRVHVARALVEAGHVTSLRQAFDKYLYDGGPAYSIGAEPTAEDTVRLIQETGGVAVLAHPWTIKNPAAIVSRLKNAGLHGLEVYRSDGKQPAYSDLAEAHNLLKLGGSDYHGKGDHDESEIGSVSLPLMDQHRFLNMARPIWRQSILSCLESIIGEPSEPARANFFKFARAAFPDTDSSASIRDVAERCLMTWFSDEERSGDEFENFRSKVSGLNLS